MRDRLHGRGQGVDDVIDHRAPVAGGLPRIAPRAHVHADGQPRLLDRRPQRIVERHIVGLALHLNRQEHRAEAQRRHPLHLLDRHRNVARRDGGGGSHGVAVAGKHLVGPVVPDPAHGGGKGVVGRGPHQQPFVGVDHLGRDAVRGLVLAPLDGVGRALLRQIEVPRLEPEGLALREVFLVFLDPHRAQPLRHAPLLALPVHLDPRNPVAKGRLDPFRPQRRRLVDVAVRRDDEIGIGRSWGGRQDFSPMQK